MATGVYCIQNVSNGKKYVGSAAKNLSKRMCTHRYLLSHGKHTNKHLQSAWVKYGRGSFTFFVIEKCEPELCLEREQYWIDLWGVCDRDKGYNKSPVAGGLLGYKHTQEAKDNMSAASKGKKKSPEHRARMSAAKRNISDETRTKLSNAAKNRSPEHREKLSQLAKSREPNYGRQFSEETRKRISDSLKESWKKYKERTNG